MRPPDEYTVVEYGENETALSPKEFKKMVSYATTLKSDLKESDEAVIIKLGLRNVSREDAEKIIRQAVDNSRATRRLRGRQSVILGLVLVVVGTGSIVADMPGYTIGFFIAGAASLVMGINFYLTR